jgi:hypothetical protein
LTVYAADKLIAQARQLAAEYRRTMGKPLPGISNEIAEHDAVKLLGLEPLAEGLEGGFDAIDPGRGNKRIQIKSRTLFDESKSGQRIGQMKLEKEWDSVVLVLMDEDYEPYEMYEAEREDILIRSANPAVAGPDGALCRWPVSRSLAVVCGARRTVSKRNSGTIRWIRLIACRS